MAEIRAVNPWTWQDAFGFAQAVEVSGARRVLYCAGQTSVDADGNPLHPGDMVAQLNQAFDNLETVLAKAGMTLANVVRLNYYTTDVAAYLRASASVKDRLEKAGCRPPGTLLGVASLFHPDILVEIEATAAD
ncbi:MAG: RidA family protein [Pseudomonadota bacterium]|nr:MAG: enamine deaminase RidA [Pseudomonadota bacterium]